MKMVWRAPRGLPESFLEVFCIDLYDICMLLRGAVGFRFELLLLSLGVLFVYLIIWSLGVMDVRSFDYR